MQGMCYGKNGETADSAVNLSLINREIFMQGIISTVLVVQKLRFNLHVFGGNNSERAAARLIC